MTKPMPPGSWTGPLHLEVRNGRNWAAGEVEVAVGVDTLHIRHQGRTLAILDRDHFRAWMSYPMLPYVVDDTRWTCELGITCLSTRHSRFTVTPESLANLMTVI